MGGIQYIYDYTLLPSQQAFSLAMKPLTLNPFSKPVMCGQQPADPQIAVIITNPYREPTGHL
jgi:hypothetical protein